MADPIEIVGPNGTISAYLTAYEFIISTIGAMCIGPFLYSLWIVRLHWKGEVTVKQSELSARIFGRKFIGFLFAAWFAISIALVEDSLDSTYRLGEKRQTESNFCARLDQLFDFSSILALKPPYTYVVDDLSPIIAQQLNCEHGLEAIDFGGDREGYVTGIDTYNAPICAEDNTTADDSMLFPLLNEGKMNLTKIYFKEFRIGFDSDNPIISLLPYSGALGKSREISYSDVEEYKPLPSCVSQNISSFPIRFYDTWEVSQFDDYNISLQVMQTICENIQKQSSDNSSTTLPTTVPTSAVDKCWLTDHDDIQNINFGYLDVECIFNQTTSVHHSSLDLVNVSATMIQSIRNGTDARLPVNKASRSVACYDISIRYHYFTISTNPLIERYGDFEQIPLNENVIVPFYIEKLAGSCVPSIHMLGFSALLYTAHSEWVNNSLSVLSRKSRYDTYLLSMARTFFPLNEFLEVTVNDTEKAECVLRDITEVTLIKKNVRFVILVLITTLTCSIILSTIVFRLVLPKHAWKIAPIQNFDKYLPTVHKIRYGKDEVTIDSDYDEERKVKNELMRLSGESPVDDLKKKKSTSNDSSSSKSSSKMDPAIKIKLETNRDKTVKYKISHVI